MARFTEADSIEEIDVQQGLAFLLFSTPNCGVCDALKLKLPSWAMDKGLNGRFVWLNLARFPAASSHFNVLSVPTLIVRLEGQELSRQLRHVNLKLLEETLARPWQLYQQSR